jgi:hypothetical protein
MENAPKSPRRKYERSKNPAQMVIRERDRQLLRFLNPHYRFKYLTTSAIAQLLGVRTDGGFDWLQRRLFQLFDAGYLDRLDKKTFGHNAHCKDFVYSRTDKAARLLGELNNASHRSNSYPHEFLVDIGFSMPLNIAAEERGWRLYNAGDLMRGQSFSVNTKKGIQHLGFPDATRYNSDPFGLTHKDRTIRLDCTPYLLDTGADLLFFPGIEADRTNESLENINPKDPKRTTLGVHIDDIFTLKESGYLQKHYGFTSFFVPIITTNETRMHNAMAYTQKHHGESKQLLFKTLPDLAYEDLSPDMTSKYFLSPWKRVGHPDLVL